MADEENMTTVPADACSIAEAARITGVAERTIRAWADAGTIWKGYQAGVHVRVSPSEIRNHNRIVPADQVKRERDA